LDQQFKNVAEDKKDPFSIFSRTLGNVLGSLETIQAQHCQHMSDEFVIPFEKFRDIDCEEVGKMKLKYKDIKGEYDLSLHNLAKANQSQENARIQEAKQKRDERFNELTAYRELFKKAIANLEMKKNTELLPLLEKYWKEGFVSYTQSQAKIIQSSNLPEVDVNNYQYIPNPQFRSNFSKQNINDGDNNNNNNIDNNNNNNYIDYNNNNNNNIVNYNSDDDNTQVQQQLQQQQIFETNGNNNNDNNNNNNIVHDN